MNLTLGTLAELKTHLLAPGLRESADFDSSIANLGRGVAEIFEKRCNRRFARVVGDVHEFSAGNPFVILPRYPLETVTKIEARESLRLGWVDQGSVDGLVENISAESGLVTFGDSLAALESARLRFTYTGGYWFDESADGSVSVLQTYKQGSVALQPAVESEEIDFAQAFAAQDDEVVVNVSLVVPAGGIVIPVNPSAVTAAGFTALLGAPVPGLGYTLRWSASIATLGTLPSGAMPDGATPRPPALMLAWLLQCEYVWKLRDKLGTDIAGGGGAGSQLLGLTLAGLQILPAVENTLRDFTRYSLL